jgi:hypothetical protein
MSETTVASEKSAKGQTHTIPSGSKEIIKKKSAELLFDPATQEFILINPSDFGALKKDIDAFDAFKPYMEALNPTHKVNEKEQAAEIKAVLAVIKEFTDAKTEEESDKIIKGLAEKIEEKKKEYLGAGNVAAGHKMKSGEIKEYLWASGSNTVRSRIVRIRSKKVIGHKWNTYKLDTKKFNEELAREKARKEKAEKENDKEEEKNKTSNRILKHLKKPEKEVELKLFEEVLFEREKTFVTLVDRNFFADIDQIDAGVGAQMFRFAAEGAVESVVDWKHYKIKSSAKASGSAALFQGKGHFTVYLPDYDGWDVWATLRDIDPTLVKHNAKPLYLAFKANIEGSAFVGACASVGLETGISLGEPKEKDKGKDTSEDKGKETKKDTKEAVAEASLDLFAGAKTSAEISLSGLMKLISDKEIKQKAQWELLGSVSWSAFAAAGIGLTMGFKVGYYDGHFQYEAKMGVVLKLGAGTTIKGAIDPIKIGQFLYTVAVSVDWLKLSDIFSGKVHSLFQSIMMNCLYTEKAVEDVVKEMADHLPQIMSATSEVLEHQLSILKSIDDTFDHYVPGYSGFKKLRAEFWLLKTSYTFLRDINKEKNIKDNAIAQTNFIEQGKRWQYASWQIKVNLISDMTQGMSILSKYSDSEKENAMLSVLRSARNPTEFKKIHLCIANLDTLFNGDRKTKFEELKLKYR